MKCSALRLSALPAGTVFADRYRINSLLGKGGMGVVYHAHDTTTNNDVALKIPIITAAYPLARFAREAEIHSRLNSPFIAKLHDYCIDPQQSSPHLVMEYLPGATLAEVLTAKTMPSIDSRLRWLTQVAHALVHLHEQEVIHRDLTPGNIIVPSDNTPGPARLIDFGAAIRTEDQSTDDESRMIGTLYYMSPEQYRGRRLDARSDIYSFGVLAYELLTGQRAFELEQQYEEFLQAHHLKLRHLAGRIPSVREKNPRISRFVSTIVQVCMQKKRQYRYDSAAEIATKLEQALHAETDSSIWGRIRRAFF